MWKYGWKWKNFGGIPYFMINSMVKSSEMKYDKSYEMLYDLSYFISFHYHEIFHEISYEMKMIFHLKLWVTHQFSLTNV